MNDIAIQEGKNIVQNLIKSLPSIWKGKNCILELKEADYQWKQMEWIGWYFEYKAKKTTFQHFGGCNGIISGNIKIDYSNKFQWDFKAHVLNSSSHPWVILNDREAIEECIKLKYGIGYIVAIGNAEYNDLDQSFKIWHDNLKGGKSKYEKDRINRGAPSRKRKTSFEIIGYKTIFIDNFDIIREGENDYFDGFQQGMRNANGSPRREKIKLNLSKIPQKLVNTTLFPK
ncbi:MAG: hypothetical protein P9L94_03720 [Candidatus Hinthialibacter antarcticus]|nr:hypothetical protein [Candidatus Hinthialibacter antarcticus]